MATTPRVIEHVPFHRDPVLKAIDAHDEAWSVWQVAPDALVVRRHAEKCEALVRLLTTPCATHFGALALLRHLRWHIDHDGIADAAVLARASDLTMYLHLDFPPAEASRSLLAPLHLKRRLTDGLYARQAPHLEPDEHTPDGAEDWRVIAPIRHHTAHVRAPRFLNMADDLVSAVLIIAGGVFAYGFMPQA